MCVPFASLANWLDEARQSIEAIRTCAANEWKVAIANAPDTRDTDQAVSLYVLPLLIYTLRLLSYPDVSPLHMCWGAHQAGGLLRALLLCAEAREGGGFVALPKPKVSVQWPHNLLPYWSGMHVPEEQIWWAHVNPSIRHQSYILDPGSSSA